MLAARGVLAFLTALSFLIAQEPAPTPAEPPAGLEAAAGRMPFGTSSQQPQAYDKVITKEAKSKAGVFTVHEVKEKYYYEIPKTELNREFLFVTQIARTTLGVGYGGQFVAEHVVRWERTNNKINLRQVNYDVVADEKTPISLAVKAANNDTILMSFPIAAFGKEPGKDKETTEAAKEEPKEPAAAPKDAKDTKPANEGKDGKDTKDVAKKPARPEVPEYKETGREPSIIIDVTRLFTSDVFELSARQRLNATMMDASRSYVERIAPYPNNIEVEATHTYSRMAAPAGILQVTNPFAAGGMRPGSATIVLHHSMVKLPEHPIVLSHTR